MSVSTSDPATDPAADSTATSAWSRPRFALAIANGTVRGAVLALLGAGHVVPAGVLVCVSALLRLGVRWITPLSSAKNFLRVELRHAYSAAEARASLRRLALVHAAISLTAGAWMLSGAAPGIVLVAVMVFSVLPTLGAAIALVRFSLPDDHPSALRLSR